MFSMASVVSTICFGQKASNSVRGRNVDNMFRTEGLQFGARTETPCDTTDGDMGIEGRLHVDTRIAYVEGVVGSGGGLLQDVEDDGRIGLGSYSFTLAIDGGEAYGGKIVGDELFRGRLVWRDWRRDNSSGMPG